MYKYMLLLCFAFGTVTKVYAVEPFVQMGLHAGGDELVGVTFVSGSTSSIDAGALFSFSGGVNIEMMTNSELRLALGYKFDDITATNGSITFDRTTLEATWFYILDDKWSIGAGITQHLDPTLDGTGVVSGNVSFKDATGIVAEIDYKYSSGMYVGGHFTSIDYETVNGAATVSGDSIGILLGWRF